MKEPILIYLRFTALMQRVITARHRDERGDVPGWVMITVMTAGVVALLMGLVGPKLSELFNSAISSVSKNP